MNTRHASTAKLKARKHRCLHW